MAYTAIDDPSAHFQVNAYSGASNPQTITNGGNSDLQPDFVWQARRDSSASFYLLDSTRGVNSTLFSDTNAVEDTATGYFASFNSDGFTTGSDSALAYSGRTYVAWQWKANGGTTSSNTSGTITSTVQANTTAGFSIVSYVGAGDTTVSTIGHSLGAVPDMIIVKSRTDDESWMVYHQSMGNGKKLYLDLNIVAATSGQWNDTTPTSTLFTTTGDATNDSGDNVIAYCFTSIQVYSKFGGYTGNGNADGPFVYLGFRPTYVLVKCIDVEESWYVWDTKRSTYNLVDDILNPHINNAESVNADRAIDVLSNGFKLRGTNTATNGDDDTYVYAAFAENPFVTSGGVPCTAF